MRQTRILGVGIYLPEREVTNQELEAINFDIIDPGLRTQYVPDQEALASCYELGRKVGKAVLD